MAEITAKRRGEVVRAVFQVLLGHPDGLPPQEAIAESAKITPPTPWEESEYPNRPGVVRYYRQLRFHTIAPSKIGWLAKTGKVWKLTDAGREAFHRFADPVEFDREAGRLYHEWDETRALEGGRAWLVRGSAVRRQNLVEQEWLPNGFVSLAASHLRSGAVASKPKLEELRILVEEDYESSADYSRKEDLVEELHAFVNRMRHGDLVVSLSDGRLYLGELTGDVEQVSSESGRSNLRRSVDWQEESYDFDTLPETLQQRLSVQLQRDLVELTSVLDQLREIEAKPLQASDHGEGQGASIDETLDPSVGLKLALPAPDETLAEKLFMPRDWLDEIRNILWDEKQIVLYGPPGTGKTYLAQHLAEFFAERDPQRVQLVQFHPSYSYEDFFEGFRPREDAKTGTVAFRITAGPLRELAGLAAREGNEHIPHFLIIDELNRANLAKVFGELYFLLEYRKRTVRLTYSGDDFGLPPNLFIIGTMNTADRSIALVDAAMRRRFAFVELSPTVEPTKGLLCRWISQDSHDLSSSAFSGHEPCLLLELLNERIDDPDFKIGPSYLMRPSVFREGGLERIWRTKILPLLEEHHYGEGVDIEHRYGLSTLRRLIKTQMAAAGAAASVESPTGPSLAEMANGQVGDALSAETADVSGH